MSYNYNVQKRLDHIQKLGILDVNKQHIHSFVKDLGVHGLSTARQVKYESIMGKIMEMIDYDFRSASKEQIKV